MHLISAKQFETRESLDELFHVANAVSDAAVVKDDKLFYTNSLAKGKTLATLFLEPSTRTRLSFEAAMYCMGGNVITVSDSGTSSAAKGESIEDMVATVSNYADIIVLRTPVLNAVERAAKVAKVPVINAGDGTGEHPTQALLDLYTIKKHRKLDHLNVMICGDLLHGRTVHSLVRLLSNYPKLTLSLTSPNRLSLPDELADWLVSRRVQVNKYESIKDSFQSSPDVVYMTRLQKERMVDYSIHADRWKDFCLTESDLKILPEKSLIMHPMPRNEEIPTSLDGDKRVRYLKEQPKNGVTVRKALIYSILCDKVSYTNLEYM
jgi:aspartate carbamoyltransferase